MGEEGDRRTERRLGWAVALALGAFAVVLTVWGVSEVRKSDHLDDVGVEVPAKVLDVEVHSGDSTTSTVRVRFTQRGDARTVTTTEITYDGDFDADHPHAKQEGVRVEYDPENPDDARFAGDSDDHGVELLVGAGVCALIAAGGVAWALAHRRARQAGSGIL